MKRLNMEEEEDIVGCITCMSTNDLCDLFVTYANNEETYAQMLETCFEIKVTNDFKYICANCVEKLEKSYEFKDQTVKSIDMLQTIKEEEYLDEAIFEDTDAKAKSGKSDLNGDDDEEHEIEALDETRCIYCDLQLGSSEEVQHHVRLRHGLEPRTGRRVTQCHLCGASLRDLADHINRSDDLDVYERFITVAVPFYFLRVKKYSSWFILRNPLPPSQLLKAPRGTMLALIEEVLFDTIIPRCHSNVETERQYACHFCDNVYNSKKACFTHLRMKHGLKLCNDHTPKYSSRDRKKCHICGRDFSQKQILNNHLWKAHGFEVEKRKAFFCPLCSERVSYGANFSAHLTQRHDVTEEVEQLEFSSMDDFMLYKSAIQEETKFRFRKTTASKQTIEGVRSHYMCSQSGIYVYQGKGKRPAPERQIYKTGKACPAHMIVTETLDVVLVTFYKTHVGHGTCPYYEPRETKRSKQDEQSLVCDTCGARVAAARLRAHVAAHGLHLFPCDYCSQLFQNIDAWTHHTRTEHAVGSVF